MRRIPNPINSRSRPNVPFPSFHPRCYSVSNLANRCGPGCTCSQDARPQPCWLRADRTAAYFVRSDLCRRCIQGYAKRDQRSPSLYCQWVAPHPRFPFYIHYQGGRRRPCGPGNPRGENRPCRRGLHLTQSRRQRETSPDLIFVTSRLLFLSTASSATAGDFIKNLVEGRVSKNGQNVVDVLASKLDALLSLIVVETPMAREAMSEMLKFGFNVLCFYPRVFFPPPHTTLRLLKTPP